MTDKRTIVIDQVVFQNEMSFNSNFVTREITLEDSPVIKALARIYHDGKPYVITSKYNSDKVGEKDMFLDFMDIIYQKLNEVTND